LSLTEDVNDSSNLLEELRLVSMSVMPLVSQDESQIDCLVLTERVQN